AIDGNVDHTCGGALGPCSVTEDWIDLYNCGVQDGTLGCTKKAPGAGNTAFDISNLVVDGPPQMELIFTGGGSKDEIDLSEWANRQASPLAKDDLVEAWSARYTGTGARSGNEILYFGASRLATNGDAQIGFWFLQESISPSGGVFVGQSGG